MILLKKINERKKLVVCHYKVNMTIFNILSICLYSHLNTFFFLYILHNNPFNCIYLI